MYVYINCVVRVKMVRGKNMNFNKDLFLWTLWWRTGLYLWFSYNCIMHMFSNEVHVKTKNPDSNYHHVKDSLWVIHIVVLVQNSNA